MADQRYGQRQMSKRDTIIMDKSVDTDSITINSGTWAKTPREEKRLEYIFRYFIIHFMLSFVALLFKMFNVRLLAEIIFPYVHSSPNRKFVSMLYYTRS